MAAIALSPLTPASSKFPRRNWKGAARVLASLETQWIFHDSFQSPSAEQEILGTSDPDLNRRSADSWKQVRQLPAHLARMCEAPLLTPHQERQLFRRMNYAKFRADRLRRQLDPQRPDRELILEIESLLELARSDRDRIAQANLRLVLSIAKKLVSPGRTFDDLVSEGIATLLKAIEKFDCHLGFRFSTYATHAVRRALYRSLQSAQRDRERFHSADSSWFESKPEEEPLGTMTESRFAELRAALGSLLKKLSPREQTIICRRFGIDSAGEVPTLQSLAAELGVCKERVRQLQQRALDKLRVLAAKVSLQPPELA